MFCWFLAARPASALDRLCDPSFENCRTPLLDLINRETQGIDVAFWFMEDARYRERHRRAVEGRRPGPPARRSSGEFDISAECRTCCRGFRSAGIPMRMRTAGGILHWKMMLFVGQGVVQFSGANYSDNAFRPVSPYANYVDEAIYFTDQPSIVNTFLTKFDSSWIDTYTYEIYFGTSSTPPLHAANRNLGPSQSSKSESELPRSH